MAKKSVGLVLSGGGARGAYEAGAVSVLLPEMAAAGEAPTRFVGTSAGALNVVALAGLAHEGWSAATKQLTEWWSTLQFADVANVPASAVKDVASYLAQVLGARTELMSLLDTGPMRRTLSKRLPLEGVHTNVRNGVVDAVAVATTNASTGGTVVFVEAASGVQLPPYDPKRNIRYVATELTVEHVLASAAVPVAFQPVRIPAEDAWYLDGGVRLNTPLKPAMKLGCKNLLVVATHPSTWIEQTGGARAPDVFEAASLLLRAVLADHMLEDLRTLVKVNDLTPAAGSKNYQRVSVRFAGPPPDQANAIADTARQVRANLIADHEIWLLEHLLGGTAGGRAELLSFLLFHPAFTQALVELGVEHAHQATGWRTAL